MTAAEHTTLAGVEILQPLPDAQRTALERECRWRNFGAEEQIIDRDSDTSDVYFVVAGRVRVVNYSYSGREVSYDDIGAGNVFGELAAIDGAPRSANVVALAPTTVAALPHEQFRKLLHENPQFAFSIMERMVQIIRGSTERILDLSTLGAYTRVYAEILRLARKVADEDGDTARINPAPVHSDIASRAGTTRETVARALSDLSRKSIAKRDGSALLVQDLWQLEDIVEGHREG